MFYSWNDLKKRNYRVGYLEGVKHNEQNLIGFIDKNKLVPQPNNNVLGLLQLLRGRSDVYIYPDGVQARLDLETKPLRN